MIDRAQWNRVLMRRLLEIGWWLRRHGDSIDGTRRWVRADGSHRGGLSELDIHLEPGVEVNVERRATPLPWEATNRGVRVNPQEIPPEQPAFALRPSPPNAVHESEARKELLCPS